MAKRKLLNVRSHLEFEVEWLTEILRRHALQQKGGTSLCPIDVQALNELVFFARAILRKHEAKNTRKDVYVER
jgi:hypothetical protein